MLRIHTCFPRRFLRKPDYIDFTFCVCFVLFRRSKYFIHILFYFVDKRSQVELKSNHRLIHKPSIHERFRRQRTKAHAAFLWNADKWNFKILMEGTISSLKLECRAWVQTWSNTELNREMKCVRKRSCFFFEGGDSSSHRESCFFHCFYFIDVPYAGGEQKEEMKVVLIRSHKIWSWIEMEPSFNIITK